MKIEDFWPKTSDPAANAAIAVVGVTTLGFIFIGGIVIALPAAIVGGIGYLIYKRYFAPKPITTDALTADTRNQIGIANYPEPDAFIRAHGDRLLDAILEDPPAYSVFLQMIRIAEELYKEEAFNNPLPPMPYANTIEEGRYRDQLLAFQKKIANPHETLALFSNTLAQTFLSFIDGLPRMAHVTKETFAQTDEIKHQTTLPLIDVISEPTQALRDLLMSCTRFRRHRVRCFMEQEVRHGEKAVYAGVQA
jgi:hypothetical protein